MTDGPENIASVSSSDDCPVCLCSSSDQLLFVQAPCGHAVCQPCMERILLTQPNGVATRGLCPICRNPVNLFELVWQNDPRKVAYPRDTNITDSPIHGLTFVGRPEEGPTFHFTEDVPYIITASDGRRIPFETFHWHDKSRTFHGTLTDESTARDWNVVLQFSSDLRYISNGIVSQTSRNSSGSNYPLDGKWLVRWESGVRATIFVLQNVFHFGPYRYELDLSNKEEIKFQWPSPLSVTQTAVEGIDLETQPQGPAVGSQVVWRTSRNERIVWTRESMGGEHVERLGPGERMYRRVDASTRSRPTYHGNTLWGNTFCQAFKVGLASYQFISPQEEGAFISYENPLCARWPPLDDGTPVPSQVYFKNISFNESERVFRGTIEWQQEYGTTWQGCSKWMYTMKFDSEYTCIVSGKVKSVFHGNNDDEQDMSTFGVDLVYINAAITEYFDALMSDPDEEETNYDRYVRTSGNLRSRLQREGASVRTIATMNHVLTVTQQPDSDDPIDYNLS